MDTETLLIMQDSIRAAEELQTAGELSPLTPQSPTDISDTEVFFARHRPGRFDPPGFISTLEVLYKELYRQFQRTHRLVTYHEGKQAAFRLVSEKLTPLRAPLRWVNGVSQRNYLMPIKSKDDRSMICSQQLTMFNYLEKIPDQNTLRDMNRMHLSKECDFNLEWLEAYLAWLLFKETTQGARAVVCKARGALEDITEHGEKRRDKIRNHLTSLEGWFMLASNLIDTSPSLEDEVNRVLAIRQQATQ